MPNLFKLCSYSVDESADVPGVIVEDIVYPLADVLRASNTDPGPLTAVQALANWAAVGARIRAWMKDGIEAAPGRPLAQMRLTAPLLYPRTIYCAGANYADHIIEMARASGDAVDADPRAALGQPWHFVRPSRSCVVGPDASIARPPGCAKLDWEVELAVVMGATARNVTAEQALESVAGYTISIDLSARDLSRRPQMAKGSPFHYDWLAHKGFEGSCPLGPWMVPVEEVDDPQRLSIKLAVNGRTMQDSNTSQMIFSVAEQIAHISMYTTLHPGDLVLTGTPAGVGNARGSFLQPGDELIASIERLGALRVSIK
ncbi:Ureidoglycolate lyase [Pigmentiphaga humi]|uniref:Ureidoglycolate lyase n=1 Tax=Pigmentiphaga humi TaxID=2478468 RepID=A0A3P4B4R1_9BURK|nr:fumarylacetoacetate hydrolase family protein [Pigmentiphaga humi]VCU71042.1 Ureidoglycolate lyase [Pigmentiphaga humi]